MKRRLRILQVTHQGDIGGSTNSITWLTDGLSRLGHDVFLCCRKESLIHSRFVKHPSVRLLPFDFGRSILDPGKSRALARLIDEHEIDIVNSHASLDRHMTIQARHLHRGRFKLIHTRRNAPLSSGGFLQGRYYTLLTDRILAVSEEVADGMVRGGVSRGHVSVVHNGIPLDRYREFPEEKVRAARVRFGIDENERVIGMMARKKSQAELLRAMEHVKEDATILFLGIDRDEELEGIRESLNLPHRVIYGGFQKDIIPLYRLLTIFVLPSVIEGFSLSILEAMALGLPVVCTDAGGNREAVTDGENGYLFRPGDTGTFGSALRKLLSDEKLRSSIGERNRAKAFDCFSVEDTVRKAEKVYFSVMDQT